MLSHSFSVLSPTTFSLPTPREQLTMAEWKSQEGDVLPSVNRQQVEILFDDSRTSAVKSMFPNITYAVFRMSMEVSPIHFSVAN